MNRRTLLLSAAAVPLAAAVPARAEPVSLPDISAYLNGVRSAESRFTQFNADGSVSTGKVVIVRPNRMRFDYDPPEETLVLASGGQVAIFDPKSNQPPEQYPLKRTPLNLIIGARIDLSRAKMVVGHGEEGEMTTVTAQDPDNPEYGTIKLYFTRDPVALREWIVTDDSGQETRVTLDELVEGGDYPTSLFSISMEIERRGLN